MAVQRLQMLACRSQDSERVCRECCQQYAAAGTPWQCNVCKCWHAEVNFPEKYRRPQCAYYRVCLTCEVLKPCAKCKERKSEKFFGALAWKARHADRRICRVCAAKERGKWACQSCGERKDRAAFSVWQNNTKQTGQIDHRGACGNRFAVQAGQISPRTRQHGHSCPLCQTLVWSPRLSGRIRSVHDTPEGKRCQKTEWTVPEPKKRKKH